MLTYGVNIILLSWTGPDKENLICARTELIQKYLFQMEVYYENSDVLPNTRYYSSADRSSCLKTLKINWWLMV